MGIVSQECYGQMEISKEAQQKQQELGEKDISPMVAIIGPTRDEFLKMLNKVNSFLKKEDTIYLSLYNTPNSHVISATPLSLLKFSALHKRKMDDNEWKFKPIKTSSPFHSPYLKDSLEKMEEEIQRFGFPFHGNQLKIPVFSFHDGRNFQKDQELALTLFREIIIKPLHWEKAISILHSDTEVTHIIDFGPGKVSSRLTNEYLKILENPPEILALSIPKDLKKVLTTHFSAE